MKKRATAGERIASKEMRMVHTTDVGRADLARKIDAAIKRAVKEAYSVGQFVQKDGDEDAAIAHGQLEHKYGVKL